MNKEELLQIVQRRGYNARIQGEEVLLQTCIFCGNPNWNLELNASKGVFSCWACKESDPLGKILSEHFGHSERIPVQMDESETGSVRETVTFGRAFKSASYLTSAVTWLSNRGIRQSDIRRYDIKVCVDKDHDHYGRIVIPIKDYWTGQVVGYTSREYLGRPHAKYLHEIKTKTSTGYRVSGNKPHVCVEGIFDGIRVHQAGFNAHILLGSGSNDRWIEWCSTLQQDKKVILLLDGDEVGQNRAEALKHLAATVRKEPDVVTLPEDMDPADVSKDVLIRLIEEKI